MIDTDPNRTDRQVELAAEIAGLVRNDMDGDSVLSAARSWAQLNELAAGDDMDGAHVYVDEAVERLALDDTAAADPTFVPEAVAMAERMLWPPTVTIGAHRFARPIMVGAIATDEVNQRALIVTGYWHLFNGQQVPDVGGPWDLEDGFLYVLELNDGARVPAGRDVCQLEPAPAGLRAYQRDDGYDLALLVDAEDQSVPARIALVPPERYETLSADQVREIARRLELEESAIEWR